eukprot:813988-Prorocentrum_minimum.AAC.1
MAISAATLSKRHLLNHIAEYSANFLTLFRLCHPRIPQSNLFKINPRPFKINPRPCTHSHPPSLVSCEEAPTCSPHSA